MNYIAINPKSLDGNVFIPTSKSICHRALICAGLSEGISNIYGITFSKDIDATMKAMSNLGAAFTKEHSSIKESTITVKGITKVQGNKPIINCFESGSTLRFMIPIVAALGENASFTGAEALAKRPLSPYYDIFNSQGLIYKNVEGKLPLTLYGKLSAGEYKVRGDISSQFISGLLFALPLLNGDSNIIITSKLESKSYVDLTIETLKKFSINVENYGYDEFLIKGNQKYKACNYKIEGDYSQAAFFMAAGVLGDFPVCCEGLNINSLQGDRVIVDLIKKMGGNIKAEGNKITAIPSKLKGITIDVSDCPDLVPILAVLAALSEGTTEIINAGRLRIKESDRLSTITKVLSIFGAEITEKKDSLIIKGKVSLMGGAVDSFNDHRIAMAAAIASIKCNKQVIIKDSQCIEKSYPNFWKDFNMLGGDIHEWSVGK